MKHDDDGARETTLLSDEMIRPCRGPAGWMAVTPLGLGQVVGPDDSEGFDGALHKDVVLIISVLVGQFSTASRRKSTASRSDGSGDRERGVLSILSSV